MAGTINQKVKLLGIINILREKTDSTHGITIEELIKELENKYNVTAERKSLYKDFQKLEELGYDVTKSKKKRSYYYYLLSREFEDAELKILVDSVQFSKFITPSKKRNLINKLLGLTSTYGAEDLKDQIYIDEIDKVKSEENDLEWNEKIYYNVDRLYRAINKKQQVKFHYIYWNTSKKRDLKRKGKNYIQNPFYLVEKHENYYLIAYDEKAGFIKHFRVDKMEDLEILDEPTVGQEIFDDVDINSYCQKRFSMFSGKETKVTLRLKHELVGVVFDLFGRDIKIEEIRKNSFEITVDVVCSGQFYGWIFANMGNVQIIEPTNVIEEFNEYMKKIRTQYKYIENEDGVKIIANKVKLKEIEEDEILAENERILEEERLEKEAEEAISKLLQSIEEDNNKKIKEDKPKKRGRKRKSILGRLLDEETLAKGNSTDSVVEEIEVDKEIEKE